jgi:kynurenine formamidase
MGLPSYDELPVCPGAPPGSSWGVWGDGDVLGCLNLLTPECARAGLASVVDGTVLPLSLDLDLPRPPLVGRSAFRHEVTWLGGERRVGHDELLHEWNTQSSSHWDGFRHIRHPEHGFYGGVADEEHGVHHWARRGIVGRAVLCDVDGYRNRAGRPLDHATADPISADDVRAALAERDVGLEPGDVLLLHTGWLGWYRALDEAGRRELAADRALATPGLEASDDTVRFLWDSHVAAVAADNPAVEIWPPKGRFLHLTLLPLLGLPLGELWELTPLVAAARADGRSACLLVSAPLNLSGGVASSANAVAIR